MTEIVGSNYQLESMALDPSASWAGYCGEFESARDFLTKFFPQHDCYWTTRQGDCIFAAIPKGTPTDALPAGVFSYIAFRWFRVIDGVAFRGCDDRETWLRYPNET